MHAPAGNRASCSPRASEEPPLPRR
jgi:hypothetical protein